MYQNPAHAIARADGSALETDDKDMQQHFEEFYEDVFYELSKFGAVDTVQVCDNVGDHLVGNVYVKFVDEDSAERAMKGLNGRFYAGMYFFLFYSLFSSRFLLFVVPVLFSNLMCLFRSSHCG